MSLEPTRKAAILFRLDRMEVAAWVPHLTLYNDGRLLRWDRSLDRLTVQRLNAAGIEAFLADLRASGSFEVSHNVPLEYLPGVQPPGIDVPADRFSLTVAGVEPVVVTSSPYHDPLVFQRSAERETLVALADRVMDTSWLPADAWTDEATRPFVPDAYLAFSGVTSQPGICPAGSDTPTCRLDMATVDLPFDLPPNGIGALFKSADGTESVIDHCALIAPEVANALASVLRPELATAAGHLYLDVSIPWRARSAFYDLTVRPLFPEEEATCAGKSLPPTIGP